MARLEQGLEIAQDPRPAAAALLGIAAARDHRGDLWCVRDVVRYRHRANALMLRDIIGQPRMRLCLCVRT